MTIESHTFYTYKAYKYIYNCTLIWLYINIINRMYAEMNFVHVLKLLRGLNEHRRNSFEIYWPPVGERAFNFT